MMAISNMRLQNTPITAEMYGFGGVGRIMLSCVGRIMLSCISIEADAHL